MKKNYELWGSFDIESDEFKENAQELCPEINLKIQRIELNIAEELENMKEVLPEEAANDEWKELLPVIKRKRQQKICCLKCLVIFRRYTPRQKKKIGKSG